MSLQAPHLILRKYAEENGPTMSLRRSRRRLWQSQTIINNIVIHAKAGTFINNHFRTSVAPSSPGLSSSKACLGVVSSTLQCISPSQSLLSYHIDSLDRLMIGQKSPFFAVFKHLSPIENLARRLHIAFNGVCLVKGI